MTAPAWLTELLAEHEGWTFDQSSGTKPDWTICECGSRLLPFGQEIIEVAHRAHVADVVWAEIERRVTAHVPLAFTYPTAEEIMDALGDKP